MNIAISYARFSSKKQGEGHSLLRQVEKAEAYALANGLVIDKELSCEDLGKSAYDQTNIRKGALGVLLEAINAGKVPIGATLIVESFDRLSRAEPAEALPVFLDILNAGLNLVTLTVPTPKLFSKEAVKANVFLLLEALLDMYRSNGESARKSELLSSAWSDKKKRAMSGALMSRKAPHWISVEVNEAYEKKHPKRRTAELNEERAAVIMRLIEGAEAGIGNHTLIKQLHADGVEAWSKSGKWQPSYIQKIMRNPALYGAIELDGEVYENYYPALIDKNRFMRLNAVRSARATTKNTSRGGETVTNLFSGRLVCGYCGSAMNIAGYKSRKTGYERKYVACHGARIRSPDAVGAGCRMHMWFLDQLEPKLLLWITGLDYKALMSTDRSQAEKERANLAGLQAEIADVTRRISNITKLIEEGEGTKALVTRQRDLEVEIERLERQYVLQRDKVVMTEAAEASGKSRMSALIAVFREMAQLTAAGDQLKLRTLREQLSAAIAQTVKRVTLFPVGPSLQGSRDDRFMKIELQNGKCYEVDDSGPLYDSNNIEE
jgi:DNA invertase Pin-like site-specific DNA recombinase